MDARHQTLFSILESVDNGAYVGYNASRRTLLKPVFTDEDVPTYFNNEPRREKTGFYPGENKGADQLRSNCESDQRLLFR